MVGCGRAVAVTYQQEDFDPAAVLGVLVDHGVQFVVLGGTAATMRGSDALTVDTDVTPARSEENLERLAQALTALGARLRTPEGELVQAPLDTASLRNYSTCATRTAEGGDLDLVFAPDGIDGGFETLARDAERVQVAGREVLIASAGHIEASRDAAFRRTQQAKYARGNAALRLAVDVAAAESDKPAPGHRAEQAAEKAQHYRAAQQPSSDVDPPAQDCGPSI